VQKSTNAFLTYTLCQLNSPVISAALATPPDFEMLNPNGKHETPTVTLDANDVSQEMAARLTIALLGQLLYMKGQVPLSVFIP
jgi:hypothetical protein